MPHDTHFTTGDIRRKLKAKPGAVEYALIKLNIAPVARAGMVRLYDEAAVSLVCDELTAIAKRTRREAVPV